MGAFALLALGACTSVNVVAPNDAYVCFPYEQTCDGSFIPQGWESNLRAEVELAASIAELPSTEGAATEIGFPQVERPATSVQVRDSHNFRIDSCPTISGVTPASPDLGASTCAVFYSPLAVLDYADAMKRLRYSILSCTRIEQAIRTQLEIFSLQDELAPPSIAAQGHTTKATRHNMTEALTEEERSAFEMNSNFVASAAEQVRRKTQELYRSKEFLQRFGDALLETEQAERAAARQVQLMTELAVQRCDDPTAFSPTVQPGAWVPRGTVVLESSRILWR